MSKSQATWLISIGGLAAGILAARIYILWSEPVTAELDDEAKYQLSRSCTDAEGWPEVNDHAVACHAFKHPMRLHLKARE